ASDVVAALSTIPELAGNVSVAPDANGRFQVTFINAMANRDVPPLGSTSTGAGSFSAAVEGGAMWISQGTLAIPSGGALGTTGAISAARSAGAALRASSTSALSISNAIDIGSVSAQTFTLSGTQ